MENSELTIEKVNQHIDERLAGLPKEHAADLSLQEERRAICNGCEHKTSIMGLDQCGLCKCLLVFKSRFSRAVCPAGKWQPHQ